MEGTHQIIDSLLPQPRKVELLEAAPVLYARLRLDCRLDDDRLVRAVDRLGRFPVQSAGSDEPAKAGSALPLIVDQDSSGALPRDGYRLEITPSGILLSGGAAAGCFYGLETLGQIACRSEGGLPFCRIEDWPDFATRGLLIDVTRGRVPNLDTLKHLVDRLVAWKVNQLQLNIEHAFVFSFDPDICAESDGLTPDEVRELDVYCRDRFIELVPAIATLGHMGRVLSMPKYKHLAEVESDRTWERMTWPERMRGLTLDCVNPDAQLLLGRMCGDIMDAFSAQHVNGCGDEPHDLGKGKNAGRLAGDARGAAYVDHLRRVHGICAARERRVMFWGDVLKSYHDLLPSLPDDVTLLHWGYDDAADYDLTARFVSSGHDTFVCPGTSGWKRILGAMDLAERNISTFAEAGKRAGAVGLLNTDWGDHGHFNMPASSWHGIALGACKAWRCDHPGGADFDRWLARNLWNIADGRCFSLLRQASKLAGRLETWRLFWQPLHTVGDDLQAVSVEEVESMRAAAREAQAFFGDDTGQASETQADFSELKLACRFLECFADKVGLAHAAARGESGACGRKSLTQWSDELEEAGRDFAECWRRRNKPSGLDDVLRALSAARDDMMASATA